VDLAQAHRVQIYEWAIGILGILAGFLYIPDLLHQPVMLTLLLIGLAVIVEAIPVPMGKVNSSLTMALPIGALMVFGPSEAIWMMIVAGLLYPVLTGRMAISVAVFNAGQYALSTIAMVLVYQVTGLGSSGAAVDWTTISRALLGALSFTVCNHFWIHLHNYLRGRFDKSDVWNVFYADSLNVALSLPFAFLMILLGPDHPYVAPIVMLPVVLIGQVVRLLRRTSVMQQVHQATLRLTTEFNEERICEDVAQVAQKLTYADAVVVFTLSPNGDSLVPVSAYPLSKRHELELGEVREEDGGVIWHVIRTKEWEYVPDTRRDSRVRFRRPIGKKPNDDPIYRSMAIIPMQFRGNVQGAIVCYAHRAYAFTETTDFIVALAKQASVLLDNAKLYRTLQEQSQRDGATGLYNYRFFYEALNQRVCEAAERNEQLSVVVADVDYFKKFNDTWGHLAGDAVLRSVGHLMSSMVGPNAIVARYGGEEFGMIIPKPPEETFELMESIRTTVAHHTVDFDGYRLKGITLSIGIAGFPQHSQNDRDLILKADSAMYWGAKQRGRNRVALYSPEFDAQLFVDELTGLYTYHFINIRIREEFAKGIYNWGVLCLDLENISYVNNIFGFEIGDRVLRETSQCIKDCLRHTELACRYGGDDFLVLLPNVTQAEVEVIAGRIQRAVSAHRYECSDSIVLTMRLHVHSECFLGLEDAADLFERVASSFAYLHQERDESFA
jgi:diguanylate cyclase (GGDEF)-like protein